MFAPNLLSDILGHRISHPLYCLHCVVCGVAIIGTIIVLFVLVYSGINPFHSFVTLWTSKTKAEFLSHFLPHVQGTLKVYRHLERRWKGNNCVVRWVPSKLFSVRGHPSCWTSQRWLWGKAVRFTLGQITSEIHWLITWELEWGMNVPA